MKTLHTTVESADGVQRAIRGWLPADSPATKTLLIAHGMAEHGARYQRMARPLVERGYAVYAPDHRGHGDTSPDPADIGHFADEGGWEVAVGDLEHWVSWCKAQHPDNKLGLLGHSMGSLLTLTLLEGASAAQLDAAVLSATTGKPPAIAKAGRYIARLERMRLGKRGHSKLLDKLSFQDFNSKFKPNRTAFDWLSRDEAEVDAYIADPRCGFLCTVQLWIDLLDATSLITKDDALARIPTGLPLYLFAGGKDPVGDMGKSVQSLHGDLQRLGLTDLALRLYDGARHETLNETNRDEVTQDLVDWLEAKLA